MKRQYVETLQEGDVVNDYFLAVRNDLRESQRGNKFLGMVFKDRTGEVGGIHWNNPEGISRLFSVGDVVNVKGTVQIYQERPQIKVEQVLPLRNGEYSEDDLVEAAVDADQLWQEFVTILQTIHDEHLSKLVHIFLEDAAFIEQFKQASAGKKWHHGYRGGLVEHCLEMAKLVQAICGVYPHLNRDLLLAAILVHDIGKLREMTQDMAVEYTTEGKLLGHLVIGAFIVEEKARQIPGFPDPLRIHLEHLVISHHGSLEFGSPMVPKSVEALVLHMVDNLGAQMNAWGRVVDETRDRGDQWSQFIGLINQQIWTGDG